jgi:nucleotide-binding universal stress UspA family protein
MDRQSEAAQESIRDAEQVVQRAVGQLCAKRHPATGATFVGDPKTVILERARTNAADFLAVGSHGVSAITRFLLETWPQRYCATLVPSGDRARQNENPGPAKP